MGIFGGGPKAPAAPPAPPPAAAPATLANPDAAASAAAQRNRDLAAAGSQSTLGPSTAQGLTSPPTAKSSLLGEGGGR